MRYLPQVCEVPKDDIDRKDETMPKDVFARASANKVTGGERTATGPWDRMTSSSGAWSAATDDDG